MVGFVAVACSGSGSLRPVVTRPTAPSSLPPAEVTASPSFSETDRALEEWRKGRPEPKTSERERRTFTALGMTPVVRAHSDAKGHVSLHAIAVSDGSTLTIQLRAEVRCKNPAVRPGASFSISGRSGQVGEQGEPEETGGLFGFGISGKDVPGKTPGVQIVETTLTSAVVAPGAAAAVHVAATTWCGGDVELCILYGLRPDGTPIFRRESRSRCDG